MIRSRRILRHALTLGLVVGGAGALAAATPTFAGLASAATPNSITTIAGDGTAGYSGDGGVAVNAELDVPNGTALDLSGNLYIADSVNNRVREVVDPTTPSKDIISTFAGDGVAGDTGNGGAATKAELNDPSAVASDSNGDLLIADTGNNVIREVSPSGVITTIAGNGTCSLKPGAMGGSATGVSLCHPMGVVMGPDHQIIISDTGHNQIDKILGNGMIVEYAGNGTCGYRGDGGKGTSSSAELCGPEGLVMDATGNLYVADHGNNVVREVLENGNLTTFAGNGKSGYSGDGGSATKAELSGPTGVGIDQSGNIYISDTGNNRIREVSGGKISTFAGNGTAGFSGDNGAATLAELRAPAGNISIDGTAAYFSDTGNQRVRGVFSGPPPVLPEVQWAILLPIGAIVLLGGGLIVIRRTRRRLSHATV